MAAVIKQYKGLEAKVQKVVITDEMVDGQIQMMLSQSPVKEEKDGVLAEGDIARIDFEGFKDGVAFPGGKGEGHELGIGSHTFIPGFEEQMVGMAKGETRDLNVTFPENYHAPELAGAAVVFKVTVHNIFTQKEAELTDEFAKSFNQPGVETVEDLKKAIHDGLEGQAEKRANSQVQEALIKALVANTECEITDEEVNEALESQLEQTRMVLMQQGATMEQYLEMTGMDMDTLKANLKDGAVAQVKLQEALLTIAELEQIPVTEEDIEAYYKEIAASYYAPVEQVKEQLPVDVLKKDIACSKSMDFVMKNAQITIE